MPRTIWMTGIALVTFLTAGCGDDAAGDAEHAARDAAADHARLDGPDDAPEDAPGVKDSAADSDAGGTVDGATSTYLYERPCSGPTDTRCGAGAFCFCDRITASGEGGCSCSEACPAGADDCAPRPVDSVYRVTCLRSAESACVLVCEYQGQVFGCPPGMVCETTDTTAQIDTKLCLHPVP